MRTLHGLPCPQHIHFQGEAIDRVSTPPPPRQLARQNQHRRYTHPAQIIMLLVQKVYVTEWGVRSVWTEAPTAVHQEPVRPMRSGANKWHQLLPFLFFSFLAVARGGGGGALSLVQHNRGRHAKCWAIQIVHGR